MWDKLFVQSDGIFQSIYSNANKNKTTGKGILTLIVTGDRADICSKISPEFQNIYKNSLDNIELLSTLKLEKYKSKPGKNEPFMEGANSVYSTGTFDVKSVLKKNHGRIHFAGEHLGNQNGTMEAALLSAIEAINGL